MSGGRPDFALAAARPRRRRIGLAVMVALAALWLVGVSRVHVNASWSDEAWGYAAFPLFGEAPEIGDRVLFEPPEAVGSPVPYLKTVRGVPGMAVTVGPDRTVFLDGAPAGRAKAHARDGRPLEPIAPGVIPPGHYYLFADHADSHDSRYAEIGLVPRGQHPGPRRRHAGHPLARPRRAAGRAGGRGCRRPGHPAASGGRTAPGCRRPAVRPPALRLLAAPGVAAALALAAPASAKDLGVRGATWPVAEPDLLAQIEARLVEMERSGALARLEDEARDGARRMLEEPEPAPGIAPAREKRSRLWDPAITVARDIRAADGVLIAAAGTRVNPLERVTLARDLLFVDGRREAEIAWALARDEQSGRPRRSCCSPAGRWS